MDIFFYVNESTTEAVKCSENNFNGQKGLPANYSFITTVFDINYYEPSPTE